MTPQEAISYLNSLTRFVYEKDAYVRIAQERKLADYEMGEVPQEVKDYCLIDLYEMVLNGPWSVASSSLQHGSFRQDVGSETVTAAVLENIKSELKRLYKKYGEDEKADAIDTGGVTWITDDFFD